MYPSSTLKSGINDLNMDEFAKSILRAQLIFAVDKSIVKYLEDYHKKLVPIYIWVKNESYNYNEIIEFLFDFWNTI